MSPDVSQPELPLLACYIPGTPRPQGSMRAINRRGTGRAIVKHNPETLTTRADVAAVLAAGWRDAGHHTPHDQPVVVTVRFTFPRPAAHWLPANTRRREPQLRPDAPWYPTGATSADVDKLCRLLGDALQLAEVLADDALIVDWRACKRYARPAANRGSTAVALRAAT